MDARERVAVIERGVVALRLIEAERRAQLPPPERDDPSLVREIRAVGALADRLEGEVEGAGHELESERARDACLSMDIDEPDAAFVLELAEDRGAGTPYRIGPMSPEYQGALRELGRLLQRYVEGEFMPPSSWFGINAPEA